jgi:hypothetical protein
MTEKSIMAAPPPGEWDELKKNPNSLLVRVSRMIVNGTRLSPDECKALVDFSITNDLNPLLGEAYCISKVGCTPGIAGWRRKASEQLFEEVRLSGSRDGYFDIDYVKASHDEAVYDEALGDIAWKAILTDTVSLTRWRKLVNEAAAEIKKIFPDESFFNIMSIAEKQAGHKPVWDAVGVVHGSEHFSGNVYRNNIKIENEYKPEMWDRNERAKKRAAKQVIRARFQGIHFSTLRFGNGEIVDSVFTDFDDEPEIKSLEEPRTENEILSVLTNNYDLVFDKKHEWLTKFQTMGIIEKLSAKQISDAADKMNLVESLPVDTVYQKLRLFADATINGGMNSDSAVGVVNSEIGK